jgi:FkbM family methyltransferase
MERIIDIYNICIHKIFKIFVDVINFKKVSIYNLLINFFYYGNYCYSYYGVKLFNVNFNDVTFRYSCGGAYSLYYFNFLKNYNNRFVFIDIGANLGLFSLAASKNINCDFIHAIEPSKSICNSLKKNLFFNKSKIYNFAISNFNGKSFFAQNIKDSGSSKLCYSINIKKKYLLKKVNVKNFSFFNKILPKQKNLDILIKIDVEGHENIVLKEIRKSKILSKVKHFYIETSVHNIKKIRYYLKDYKLLSINPIISSNNIKKFCDLEFVKKNSQK